MWAEKMLLDEIRETVTGARAKAQSRLHRRCETDDYSGLAALKSSPTLYVTQVEAASPLLKAGSISAKG
jgi:hypothetical protein